MLAERIRENAQNVYSVHGFTQTTAALSRTRKRDRLPQMRDATLVEQAHASGAVFCGHQGELP
jgi:hypothetical protein